MNIVEMEKLYLVELSVRAEWKELWTVMPKAWKQLFVQASQIEHRGFDHFVDASLEVESGIYLQLIGSEVRKVDRVPEGMIAVEVPAQQCIHHRHLGPTAGIAASFGKMYEWANDNGHNAAELKLDAGYTANGMEASQELYVAIHPVREWTYLNSCK